jgi:hypothetical protein
MGDRSKITLGGGVLYVDAVDVGYLRGKVEFEYVRLPMTFQPAGAGLTTFIAPGACELRADLAEFDLGKLRIVMGATGTVAPSSSFPTYNPSSFSADSSDSFDSLTFGDDVVDSTTHVLRFEHTRPNGRKVIIVLYKLLSASLRLPFSDTDPLIYGATFKALPDESRDAGDRMGVIVDQVLE